MNSFSLPTELKDLTIVSKTHQALGTWPEIDPCLCWVTDAFGVEGMSDYFEYAMGWNRGALEKDPQNLPFVAHAELHPNMREGLQRGLWALLPETDGQCSDIISHFHENTHNRGISTRHDHTKMTFQPHGGRYIFRLFYWPHLVTLTKPNGCTISPGDLVSSPIHPSCALGSLTRFFHASLDEMVVQLPPNDQQSLAMQRVYSNLVRQAEMFHASIIRRMPKEFLDQDRGLKRINPFFEGGNGVTSTGEENVEENERFYRYLQ